MSWVFSDECRETVQLLGGPCFNKTSLLLWFNAIKEISEELWFERNQRVFHDHDRSLGWLDCYEVANRNVSSWCILSKEIDSYSMSEFN